MKISENYLVSVVIPVHNGERFISRTVKKLTKQSYRNIEIILVENFSSDKSGSLCDSLVNYDNRVVSVKSYIKGTSFARKKGVEIANGQYIIFMDQDDSFINNRAIEEMSKTIVETGAQICQFGYYREYLFGYKRLFRKTDKTIKFDRKNLFQSEVKGILGDKDSVFDTTVWNKIYDAEIIKSAELKMDKSLFFAEDEYINVLSFFDDKTKKVVVSDKSYYVWNSGVGFSSSANSNFALIEDYEKIKPTVVKYIKKYCDDTVLFNYHLETVYFMRFIVNNMIENDVDKETVIKEIVRINQYECIKIAKEYFNVCCDKTKIWEELKFLISDFTADAYYEYCLVCVNNTSVKGKFKKTIEKTMRRLKK